MTKFSDVPAPSLLIVETVDPAAPAAGHKRLFIDTDHKLKTIDSASTVVDYTPGAGGAVATDAIWDAAGDLAVGTGADTAGRLAKGAAGGVLAMGNSAVIWNAGTSFPASKATGDRYWRTDLGMEFYWDGTRWVSTVLYVMSFGNQQAVQPLAATSGLRMAMPSPTLDIYALDFWSATYVSTTNDGSKYWTIALDTPSTTLSTINNSAASLVIESAAVNAAIAVASGWLTMTITKVSTPGTLFCPTNLSYRYIAT